MNYKCKKCGELYNYLPEECDFDSETEFWETEICENCGEYQVLYNNLCEECIKEMFSVKLAWKYIRALDKRREEWGLEPFYEKEVCYFAKKENKDAENDRQFLWEYCRNDLQAFAEFVG